MVEEPGKAAQQSESLSTELQNVLAENLKGAREAIGLSQAELGRRTHISRTSIIAIEEGRQNVTLRSVERLAKAVGRKASDLLCQPT